MHILEFDRALVAQAVDNNVALGGERNFRALVGAAQDGDIASREDDGVSTVVREQLWAHRAEVGRARVLDRGEIDAFALVEGHGLSVHRGLKHKHTAAICGDIQAGARHRRAGDQAVGLLLASPGRGVLKIGAAFALLCLCEDLLGGNVGRNGRVNVRTIRRRVFVLHISLALLVPRLTGKGILGPRQREDAIRVAIPAHRQRRESLSVVLTGADRDAHIVLRVALRAQPDVSSDVLVAGLSARRAAVAVRGVLAPV
mmetsp:Transcript_10083/g.31584  ORF Transcript_10083/g.31584 Transcript_10083/m.31584 type:complete len:257 (-) Transcript_10083:327-1097(-)